MSSTEFSDLGFKQEELDKMSQEVGEIKAEPLEAPEVIKRVEQVTFDPEAVVQREGDYMQAEAIEAAFVELIVEQELPPGTWSLMPASIELELPEVQNVQPALSDASDIQPPTSGLPGLSEVGTEMAADKLVSVGESGIRGSDQAGSLTDTPLTLEQALSSKPALESEASEASQGEVEGVPLGEEKIVSMPESGEETQTQVVGTAEQTMDLDAHAETPEMVAVEAIAELQAAYAESIRADDAWHAAYLEYDRVYMEYGFYARSAIESFFTLSNFLLENGFDYHSFDMTSHHNPCYITVDLASSVDDPSLWSSMDAYVEFCGMRADLYAKVADANEFTVPLDQALADRNECQEQMNNSDTDYHRARNNALEALIPLVGWEAAHDICHEAELRARENVASAAEEQDDNAATNQPET